MREISGLAVGSKRFYSETEIIRCGAAVFWSADAKMQQSVLGSSAGSSDTLAFFWGGAFFLAPVRLK